MLAAAPVEVPTPPGEPRLEWIAPTGCPDAVRGTEELAHFLGGRALPESARVELAEREGGGYVATVAVAGATRALRADECDTLARAAALVVAVSLEPVITAEVVHRGDTGAPAAIAPATVAPSEDEALTEPTEPAASTSSRIDLRRADRPDERSRPPAPARAHWLGASGGVAFAHVPALTAVTRLSYAFTRRALRVQAELTYAVPRTITYPTEPALGGRFQSVALGARACFAPAVGRVAAPLCAGFEGGPVVGRGVAVLNVQRPTPAYLGALVGGAIVVRASSRVAVTAGAELLVAALRPAFYVGARDVLLRAPEVGLRGFLGLELRVR